MTRRQAILEILDREPPQTRHLELARLFVSWGWYVFPLASNSKIPVSRETLGLHADAPAGLSLASVKADDIESWWGPNPTWNIGLACGQSGLVVIDPDTYKPGVAERWADLSTRIGMLETFTVETPRGGSHYYLALNGHAVSSREIAPGIDCKSAGGYVVAPGSVIDGKVYLPLNDTEIEDIPVGWLAALPISSAKAGGAVAAPAAGDPMPRNVTLTSLAGAMRRKGLPEDAIRRGLEALNKAIFPAPLEPEEVAKISHSVARYPSAALDQPQTEAVVDPDVVVRLSDVEISAPEFDADPVLRRHGLHFIIAAPGSMKTYLMLLIAMQQTQLEPGEQLLGIDGWTIRRRWRSVLWLGDEESAGELRYRAEVLARGHGLRAPQGDEILFADASGGSTMLDVRHIPQIVTRYPEVDAVIADPLANLTPAVDDEGRPVKVDLDNAWALRQVCRPLRRLAKQRDLAVFLAHHLNSTGERERGPTAYRGSTDVLIRLDLEVGMIKLDVQKNRDGEKPRLHLEPVWTGHRTAADNPLTLSFRKAEAVPAEETKLPPTAVKMLAAIRAAGPLTRFEIGSAAPGVDKSTRSRALGLLKSRGLVAEEPDGRFIALT